ncbi:retrotransposon protein, putative, ty1-copia subclass [Tanacetum coccineum]
MQKGSFSLRGWQEILETGRYTVSSDRIEAPGYGVLVLSGYGVLDLVPLWSLMKCRHIYAISSLEDTDDLKFDDESVDTPLVSPFLDSDDKSDDGEVLNKLDEYGNAGNFYRNRIINSLDGEDLAFPCMIGFRKFVAYFDPFLPMNIITHEVYNIIMVEGLKGTGRNLVAIVRDVYVFLGSFTYVTDFVVLEDIKEFIVIFERMKPEALRIHVTFLDDNLIDHSYGVSTDSEDTMYNDTLIGVTSVAQEGVTSYVVDLTALMENQSSLEDTTGLGSLSPLPMQVNTLAGNSPGKSSYANAAGKPNGKKFNIRTLFTPVGIGIDMVVLVESIQAISDRFANTEYGYFLGKRVAYHVVANYVRNTWGKFGLVRTMFNASTILFSFQFSSMDGLDGMLENGPWFIQNNPLILKKWHPNENLFKKDVSIFPVSVKLHGVPVTAFSDDGLSAISTKLGTPLMLDSYTSDMCKQSWGRSSYASVMIELRADVELKDNIVVAMSRLQGRVITHVMSVLKEDCDDQAFRGVPVGPKIAFKPQYEYRSVTKKPNISSSSNKKKCVEPTIEVSNSNPFDVLNSVDNDVEFGTNGGTSNLGNNEATPSGSSFMNIDNDGEFACNTPIGYGTNSLLEQWRDYYPDKDDYDPYDDDMYENHDLSEHLQSICDDLDITVCGRKKK